jgi:hypothetical protein
VVVVSITALPRQFDEFRRPGRKKVKKPARP